MMAPPPYGGALVDLLVTGAQADDIVRSSINLPSWTLSRRQRCDLELLLNGGFSPLTGFMTSADYAAVCAGSRLVSGTLWPIPVTLGVTSEVAEAAGRAGSLVLRDMDGIILAVMRVRDVWQADRRTEVLAVFGTEDPDHPGVSQVLSEPGPWCVGGPIDGVSLPPHFDFRAMRFTPAALRARLSERGWGAVVAFQTRNPMHRAHYELTRRAMSETGARLLIHPSVGATRPDDIDHFTRVRSYRAILPRYPADSVELALLPLAMRIAGPREAVWHAIIRRNYGCTHFIVGRDHAGPGADRAGRPYYDPLAAQDLAARHEQELGITIVRSPELVCLPGSDRYVPADEVPEGVAPRSLSGTELRRRLAAGETIPEWFSFPEVVRELAPLPQRTGLVVFLTGLPGAGKSTLARALSALLLETGVRDVEVLDGDEVRARLWPELGFSAEDRRTNIRRIGGLALDVARRGGIAICAAIAPSDDVRKEVRREVEPLPFVLVHVGTPIDVCERRDRKGFFAQARKGTLHNFTGISAGYEVPADAELRIDATDIDPVEAARTVLAFAGAN